MLLRDNDMIRKWEEVTTTDTFTMYYASVFRGRLDSPRQRVTVKYVCMFCARANFERKLQVRHRHRQWNRAPNTSIRHPWSIGDLRRHCERQPGSNPSGCSIERRS
jgi:hypothetical protein